MKRQVEALFPAILVIGIMFLWIPINIDYRVAVDNDFERLWIHCPTTIQEGEPFDLHVQAWDFCERQVIGYENIVTLSDYLYNTSTKSLQLLNASLISPYRFTSSGLSQGFVTGNYIPWGDNGNHKFSQITVTGSGIHYIKVTDDKGNEAFSNPILVTEDEPNTRIYWGDIHGHSSLSDGSGYPNEVLAYARDVAVTDFVALTDHDFIMELYDPLSVEYLHQTADSFNAPGKFVTIISYEYTNQKQGHLNVYFKNNIDPAFFSVFDYKDPDLLWAALEEWKAGNPLNDVFTIPHHAAAVNAYDWSYYHPDLMPLVEVYSSHGSSEMREEDGNPRPCAYKYAGEQKDPGYHIVDALSMGYRVGFMCSSDSHDGRMGHPLLHTAANNPISYPFTITDTFRASTIQEGSLTAVMIENLTRENVFMSLKNRTCYGTTHVNRMFLNFTINGYSVGGSHRSELDQIGISTVNSIEVFAAADYAYNLSRIEIFRNSQVFCTLNGTGLYNTTHKLAKRNGLGIIENLTLSPGSDFNFTVTGTQYTGGLMKNGNYYVTNTASKSLEGYNLTSPPSTNGIDNYYLRVIQEKPGAPNDIGWIGPIWIG